jgi:hypothetical protein
MRLNAELAGEAVVRVVGEVGGRVTRHVRAKINATGIVMRNG